MMTKVSFGLKTSQQGVTYRDILELWQEADQVICPPMTRGPYPSAAWLSAEIVEPVIGEATALT